MTSMQACVADLEKHGHLKRISASIDPFLELAEIQRRAYLCNAPALLFENVKGTPFPCLGNLFGTKERAAFIFRDTLPLVQEAVRMKADPAAFAKGAWHGFMRNPLLYMRLPFAGLTSLPKHVTNKRAPVMACQTTLGKLPQIHSWPRDGGAFITLPQVYSEDLRNKGPMSSNLGMYRIQISGNDYERDREVGMHYQIHRGLGIHHTAALQQGENLPVSIFVGGHPAHTVAAVMPLPEGLSELIFAGMLAGRRFRYSKDGAHTLAAEADFCITGTLVGRETKPEGPFGDHLGYYSLQHDFPVLRVDKVFHRKDAIWPFTVVGRPPQEDTTFGQLIHEITKPMVPVSLPGVSALHAIDAAGVHPLLLAIGSERYVPYRDTKPQELLTQAHAILGFNQCSLAKYLFLIDGQNSACPDIEDIPAFFRFLWERVDLTRDLHFHTRTTIDTLDYSGEGLNAGSKLVIVAAGDTKRRLAQEIPGNLRLPSGFSRPKIILPGILIVQGPKFSHTDSEQAVMQEFCLALEPMDLGGFPLIVVGDDSEFAARKLNNFLWTTFTRSNPSHDCYGIGSFVEFKHWGTRGSLVIDARLKPHHAPPLVEDPSVTRRVDDLCKAGGPLAGIVE